MLPKPKVVYLKSVSNFVSLSILINELPFEVNGLKNSLNPGDG